jgi:hypothetical protein
MNSLLNDINTDNLSAKTTQMSLSCYSHNVLVKKNYFNRSTNHHKDLEFLEKTNVFVLELLLPANYSNECRVQYDIFSDKNNQSQHKMSGTIKNNTSTKIITIIADSEDDEYFVSIKILAPDTSNVIEVCHQFVSKQRAEKALTERQKKSTANLKYKEENINELEEIVEYASFTRAFITPTTAVDLLGLFNAANAQQQGGEESEE